MQASELTPSPLQSQDVSSLVPSAAHGLIDCGNSSQASHTARKINALVQDHLSHAMRRSPPSQPRTMSQSDGDTQPLSPRVYDEFAGRSKTLLNPRNFAGSNETNSETNEFTERSYLPGQIGHVDLVGAFEQAPNPTHEKPSQEQDDEEDPLSQGAEVRAEIYPESNRFQAPKTPATNGKLRNRKSTPLEHGNITPHLPLNPFAGQIANLDVMNASQAFKATQAVSSPLMHIVHSDGLSERPSPDMYSIHRPATAGSLSSPTRMANFGTVRAAIEPQTTYISMQESQAERDNRLKQAALRKQSSTSGSSDDDFDSDDSQIRRRRLQKSIDLKAKGQFLGVTAPPRSGPSGRGRGKLRQHHQTESPNSRLGKRASEALIISDELSAEENITEDETDHEVDLSESVSGEIDELADDNKENVEVPRSVRKQYRRKASGLVPQSTPFHHLQGNIDDSPSLEPRGSPEMVNQNHGTDAKLRIKPGTQTSTIADSQISPDSGNPWQPPKTAIRDAKYSADPRVDIPQSPPHVLDPSLTSNATLSTKTRFTAASSGVEVMHRSDNDSSSLLVKSSSIVDMVRKGSLPTETDTVPSSAPPVSERKINAPMIEDTRIPQGSNFGDNIQAREQVTSEEPPRLNAAVGANAEEDESKPRTVIPASSPDDIPSSTFPSEIPETSSAVRRPMNSNDTSLSTKMRSAGSSIIPRPLLDSSLAGSTPFETAQTRLPNSSYKSHRHSSPPKSLQSISSSGQSSLPPKTFGQIAADPSPLDPIGEIDIDINLLSNEDVEFQNVINGSSPVKPAKKRRNGNSGQVLAAIESEQDPRLEPEPKPRPVPTKQAESELNLDGNQHSQPRNLNYNIRKTVEQDPSAVDELADENLPINAGTSAGKTMPSNHKTSGDGHTVESKTRSPRGRPRKVRSLEGNSVRGRPSNCKDKARDAAPGLAKSLSTSNESSNLPGTTNGVVNNSTILAPNRVFAYFNGNSTAYYPATCIGVVGGNESRLQVRFDDGTVDTISQSMVKRLELRMGDLIKVDTSGSRTTTYVVQGLSDPCYPSAVQGPVALSTPGRMSSSGTDVYGNATVLATAKKRQSGDAYEVNEKVVSISITNIYLTPGMWTNFKDRLYNFASDISPPFSRLQTPSETASGSTSSTSRDRRPKMSGAGNPRSSLTMSTSGRGLFKNMVFTVTNILHQVDRDRTTRLVLSNGGHMLADGFNELFDIPELELISASKPSPKKSTTLNFGLTQVGQRTGFACLIADKHCRKAKYIEALALGIPCLATRWVQDCVTARRVLPWEAYLLSSGESSFLGGAVRSRMLPAYSPTDIALPSIVDNRPKLLAGESVLLVMSKAEEEIMRNHPLFTHALGASKVSRVASLEAAAKVVTKAYVDGEPWDWLYSHDNEKQAEKVIFGSNSGGRKRKRVWDSEMERDGATKKKKTRVVGNEFVVQSLILGRLVDLN